MRRFILFISLFLACSLVFTQNSSPEPQSGETAVDQQVADNNNQSPLSDFISGSDLITIYPNPSNGKFRIQVNTEDVEEFSMTIIDPVGREIIPPKGRCKLCGTFDEEIQIKDKVPGIYIVVLKTPGSETPTAYRKVIIY